MKWSKSIALVQPLRDVQLRAPLTPERAAELRRLEAEKAAYERGRRDGEKALGEQLLQQRAELIELQQGVLQALRNVVPQVVRETETAVLEMAVESARKIVAGLPISLELVEAVVREALAQIEDTAGVTVQLHPDDLALLRKQQSPLLQGLPEGGPLRFTGSAEVSRGGCLVQTRFGILDASRETKFDQIREALCA